MRFLTGLLMHICSYCCAAAIPEPYASINDLPFDDHGWFGNARQLELILERLHPKVVIEIGSWLGCSTRFLASHTDDGAFVYAVDTWKGSPQEDVHMQDPRLPFLYQLFLSNVKHAGLTHKIIPIRMESLEAARALNLEADLIYLDAAHDTASVRSDILHWYPHLSENGVLCGDDWYWGSVRVAVMECASILNKKVYNDENFWWYE